MMESCDTQRRVLYEAHSIVRNHKDLGDVMITWYRHNRSGPLSSYEKLINGYSSMDEETQFLASQYVDGLFTPDEIEMLGVYLEKSHGIEIYLTDSRVTVKVDPFPGMDATVNPAGDLSEGDIWMLLDGDTERTLTQGLKVNDPM